MLRADFNGRLKFLRVLLVSQFQLLIIASARSYRVLVYRPLLWIASFLKHSVVAILIGMLRTNLALINSSLSVCHFFGFQSSKIPKAEIVGSIPAESLGTVPLTFPMLCFDRTTSFLFFDFISPPADVGLRMLARLFG